MSTIDTSGFVSEMTKKTLEQFGWQPGEPVLPELSDLIQKIREDFPPKKPGVLIDIDVMSQDAVAAVKSMLAAAKQTKKIEDKKRERQEEILSVPPGVQDGYAKILALTEEKNEELEIVDDRADAVKAQQAPQQPPPPTPDIPPPEKPDTSIEAGVAQPNLLAPVHPAFCPRCAWDLRRDYDVEIDPVDKENFLTTILSGGRFKKEYAILNGRYKILFRTLLAEENKVIHKQLMLEQRANEFLSDTEWFLRFFEYRLACSVESISVNDKLIAILPTLDEIDGQPLPTKMDDPSLPGLARLYDYVVKELFGAEVTRRLAGKQFREFQRLYEALEAMALEPNFW